jgi:hypothetical protein
MKILLAPYVPPMIIMALERVWVKPRRYVQLLVTSRLCVYNATNGNHDFIQWTLRSNFSINPWTTLLLHCFLTSSIAKSQSTIETQLKVLVSVHCLCHI